MTTIRCKFQIDKIERSLGNRRSKTDPEKWEQCETRTLHMSPVAATNDPNHENSKFWEYTPSGKLELTSVNVEAVDSLELGDEYFVDITPAT